MTAYSRPSTSHRTLPALSQSEDITMRLAALALFAAAISVATAAALSENTAAAAFSETRVEPNGYRRLLHTGIQVTGVRARTTKLAPLSCSAVLEAPNIQCTIGAPCALSFAVILQEPTRGGPVSLVCDLSFDDAAGLQIAVRLRLARSTRRTRSTDLLQALGTTRSIRRQHQARSTTSTARTAHQQVCSGADLGHHDDANPFVMRLYSVGGT